MTLIAAMATLAAGVEAAVVDPSVWAQYGPATVSAAVFAGIAGVLFKALMKTLDLERAQNVELRAENRALNKEIHEKYIPTVTTVMAEATRLAQVTNDLTRVLQARRDHDR